jgi:NAD(P)-dependent dehydrogenase (short-subunit alcohol dehydrogenase family)
VKLRNKVAIITGGSSGIGRATAVLFAKEGANVVIGDIDVSGGEGTASLIKKEKGDVLFIKTDVSKTVEVQNMVKRTIEKYGKIDILVNNSGVVRVGSLDDYSEDDFDLLFRTNVKGIFLCCKYVVPYMKKQKSGVIVNLASIAAHVGQVNHSLYCASKAGALAITRALALDLAPYNIRVNSISPGATDTPMLRSDVAKQAKQRNMDPEDLKKEFEAQGVLGRWAKPEEVATGILYLASDDSSYMTGADILIDGGWAAR